MFTFLNNLYHWIVGTKFDGKFCPNCGRRTRILTRGGNYDESTGEKLSGVKYARTCDTSGCSFWKTFWVD